MKKKIINLIVGIVGVLTIGSMIYSNIRTEAGTDILYSEFVEKVEEGDVAYVKITEQNIIIHTYNEGEVLNTDLMSTNGLSEFLSKNNISFTYENKTGIINSENMLYLLLLGFLLTTLYISNPKAKAPIQKEKQTEQNTMGKNKSKAYLDKGSKVSFHDVAGQEEAKESLKEIIDYLHNADKYKKIGAKIPKGVLLVGPPGTGKTMLAKAAAGEANVPFFSLSGSDFVEMFVGVGASRVRDLFEEAKKQAPCIIFIDEIDAIGKKRGMGNGNVHDEREQTLNQLLTEMDGFDTEKAVIVLSATNRPETLDSALLRPGRFDRRVIVDKPDITGRMAILQVYGKKVMLDKDVDLKSIALATSGAVGADLANIVNEAALNAVRRESKSVSQKDFIDAVELVFTGAEKKDKIMSLEEKKIIAYHEVGHAVVSAVQKGTSPLQKITIVPRTTGSLGYTMQIPETEKYIVTKEDVLTQVRSLMGGRVAEEVFFNTTSTGASNDIDRITRILRSAIAVYGMSEKFDMVSLENKDSYFLDATYSMKCSESMHLEIDKELIRIVKALHEQTKEIITSNKEVIIKIADVLIQKEKITGEEFMSIFNEFNPSKIDFNKTNVFSTPKEEKIVVQKQPTYNKTTKENTPINTVDQKEKDIKVSAKEEPQLEKEEKTELKKEKVEPQKRTAFEKINSSIINPVTPKEPEVKETPKEPVNTGNNKRNKKPFKSEYENQNILNNRKNKNGKTFKNDPKNTEKNLQEDNNGSNETKVNQNRQNNKQGRNANSQQNKNKQNNDNNLMSIIGLTNNEKKESKLSKEKTETEEVVKAITKENSEKEGNIENTIQEEKKELKITHKEPLLSTATKAMKKEEDIEEAVVENNEELEPDDSLEDFSEDNYF